MVFKGQYVSGPEIRSVVMRNINNRQLFLIHEVNMFIMFYLKSQDEKKESDEVERETKTKIDV